MPAVNVKFIDGTNTLFEDSVDRSPSVRYEGEFAIVTDRYGAQFAYPVSGIKLIETDAPRRSW